MNEWNDVVLNYLSFLDSGGSCRGRPPEERRPDHGRERADPGRCHARRSCWHLEKDQRKRHAHCAVVDKDTHLSPLLLLPFTSVNTHLFKLEVSRSSRPCRRYNNIWTNALTSLHWCSFWTLWSTQDTYMCPVKGLLSFQVSQCKVDLWKYNCSTF